MFIVNQILPVKYDVPFDADDFEQLYDLFQESGITVFFSEPRESESDTVYINVCYEEPDHIKVCVVYMYWLKVIVGVDDDRICRAMLRIGENWKAEQERLHELPFE